MTATLEPRVRESLRRWVARRPFPAWPAFRDEPADPGASLPMPPELVELIAERAAEIAAERSHSAAEDGWLRGAEAIADYIDAPTSRVYALVACNPPRIPVHRDGSALVAKRSDLDAWIIDGGGKRP